MCFCAFITTTPKKKKIENKFEYQEKTTEKILIERQVLLPMISICYYESSALIRLRTKHEKLIPNLHNVKNDNCFYTKQIVSFKEYENQIFLRNKEKINKNNKIGIIKESVIIINNSDKLKNSSEIKENILYNVINNNCFYTKQVINNFIKENNKNDIINENNENRKNNESNEINENNENSKNNENNESNKNNKNNKNDENNKNNENNKNIENNKNNTNNKNKKNNKNNKNYENHEYKGSIEDQISAKNQDDTDKDDQIEESIVDINDGEKIENNRYKLKNIKETVENKNSDIDMKIDMGNKSKNSLKNGNTDNDVKKNDY